MSTDTRERITDDELRKITGVSGAAEEEMETRAKQNEQKEKDRLEDQVGKGFTGGDEAEADTTPQKRWFTRKKAAAAGGISVLLIGGTLGFLNIGQGPFKIIHAAQLLQQFHFSNDENFMDGRAGTIIRWARTRNSPEKRNLSHFGNLIADHYENKMRSAGIEPTYRNERIVALDFNVRDSRARLALDEIEASGLLDVPAPDADGIVHLDLPTGSGTTRIRRVVMRGTIGAIGLKKISSAEAKRILVQRAGVDFHPIKNIARGIDEDIADYRRERREDKEKRHATGDPEIETRYAGDPGDDPDAPNAENQNAANTAAGVVEGKNPAKIETELNRIFTGGIGAATAATLICSLDQLGDSIPDIRQAQVVLPLMRIGMEVVTMGNQVMANHEMSLDELGATVTQFYDETAEIGKDFFSARTFQAGLGQEQNGVDMPDAAKPNVDRPQVFQVINTVTSATGISQVCGFVTSTAGGWAVDIADWGTSGGPAQAIVAAVQDVLVGVAISNFASDMAQWLAGKPLQLTPLGAMYGNYANYGARLGANESAIAHGGTPLSARQSLELKMESDKIAQIEFKQRNAFDRYLNPYESRSLVGRAMIQNPDMTSPTKSIANVFSSPTSLFSGLFRNMYSTISPKAAAQAGAYDYIFPEFGVSAETANDERYEDPFAHETRVEGHIAEYNQRFGKCFGTTIDPTTFEIQTNTTEGVRYDHIMDGQETGYEECNDGSQALNDYSMYLADQFVIKGLACHAGLDERACREIGFGAPLGSPGTGPAAGVPVDGFIFPLDTTKATITGMSPAWCSTNQSNCHHHYNAADIFAPTGTTVVAFRGGTVISSKDNDSSSVGSRVVIRGDDGNLYYYAHMGNGTVRVTQDQQIVAGTPLGQVGTRADAVGTDPHLHIDSLPGHYDGRVSCSGASCMSYPFRNIQPVLTAAFNALQ